MNQSEALDSQIANKLVKRLEEFMAKPDIVTFAGELTMDTEKLIKAEQSALLNRIEAGLPQLKEVKGKFDYVHNEVVEEVKQLLQQEKERL